MSKDLVIAIDFQQDFAKISELKYENEHVLVTKLRTITLPPKTIINGEITDPSSLSNQVVKTLRDMESTATRLVVSIQDNRFFKHLRQYPIIRSTELSELLEEEVAASALFIRDDFEMSYQVHRPQDGSNQAEIQHVMCAAVKQSQVESIQEFVEQTGLHLIAIDLVPLAALRLFMYRNTKSDLFFSVFVDKNTIDLNIFKGETVYFTFSIQLETGELTDEDILTEYIVNRFNYFFMAYSNYCFDQEMPTQAYFFSRNEFLSNLFDVLQDYYPDIIWNEIKVSDLVNTDPMLAVEEAQLAEYMVSIGLGLKAFEYPRNKTLNLSGAKLSYLPAINYRDLKFAGLTLMLLVVLMLGLNFYSIYAKQGLTQSIKTIQNTIKSLQTGEVIARQNQLNKYQSVLKSYNRIRDEKQSRTDLLLTLVDQLPEDLSFKSVRLPQRGTVEIKGSASYQESIYRFYQHLKKSYKDVELSSIVSKYKSNAAPENQFEISFKGHN